MKFIPPLSKQKSHIVGYAIVDDADIVESAVSNTATGEEILLKAQEALDHWEGGLRATGGAIVPAKSHWYFVDFQWRKGKWSYSCFDPSRTLKVKNEQGHEVTVQQVPVQDTESQCMTGQLLQQNWELMQLEMGVVRPMQDIKYKKFAPLMTSNWLQRAWQHADAASISIFQEKLSSAPLCRENDKYFMDVVVALNLDNQILQAVNRCRLYLRLLRTSDILTGDRKFIRQGIWKGERESQYGWDENWPVQGEPSPRDWTH